MQNSNLGFDFRHQIPPLINIFFVKSYHLFPSLQIWRLSLRLIVCYLITAFYPILQHCCSIGFSVLLKHHLFRKLLSGPFFHFYFRFQLLMKMPNFHELFSTYTLFLYIPLPKLPLDVSIVFLQIRKYSINVHGSLAIL